MKARKGLLILPLLLAPASMPAAAQNSSIQTITVLHAVANAKTDGAPVRELALKENFAERCDGREKCSQDAREILPGTNFIIELTYVCRDSSGSSRQIGPKKFDGTQVVELTCN